jgi:hypothetical protein
VLRCEELDSYKNQVKGRLRAWVDEMNERNQQWLVLYMPMGARSSSKSFLSKGGTTKVCVSGPHTLLCTLLVTHLLVFTPVLLL